MANAAAEMTDYSVIRVTRRGRSMTELGASNRRSGDRLTPHKTLALHQASRDFLERELAHDPAGQTVVVTHHAPHPDSLHAGSAIRSIDAAYGSDLRVLVEKADLWMNGYVHKSADYYAGSARVVSNPRGYVKHGLNRGFNPGLVVEI